MYIQVKGMVENINLKYELYQILNTNNRVITKII